jgi:hypothetical protein
MLFFLARFALVVAFRVALLSLSLLIWFVLSR